LRVLIRGGETSTVEFKVASPRVAELADGSVVLLLMSTETSKQ